MSHMLTLFIYIFFIFVTLTLSVVINQGLRLLICKLEPQYEIIRQKIIKAARPDQSDKVCKHTVEKIKYVQVISFITNI